MVSFKPKFILAMCLLFFLLWFIPWVLVFYTGVVVYFPYEPDGKSRYIRVTGPLSRALFADSGWAKPEEINSNCRAALVASEDMRFYEHNGIDIESIDEAIKKNRRKGKIRWGASTITQQLVKNVFLYRNKSYFRKAREVTGALLLDLVMNKQNQITWYLNVVEFGPRIYGIKPAAQYYFHKKPQNLSLSECVALASILPSPKRGHRALRSGAYSSALKRKQQRILQRIPDAKHSAEKAQK